MFAAAKNQPVHEAPNCIQRYQLEPLALGLCQAVIEACSALLSCEAVDQSMLSVSFSSQNTFDFEVRHLNFRKKSQQDAGDVPFQTAISANLTFI